MLPLSSFIITPPCWSLSSQYPSLGMEWQANRLIDSQAVSTEGPLQRVQSSLLIIQMVKPRLDRERLSRFPRVADGRRFRQW